MESRFDFSSVVKPSVVALKILGFWKSSHPDSIFNTIWYRSYTVAVILLQVLFEGTGFLYLYDKWECLSLVDIISVIFIYSTGVVNLAMMIVIFFNIDCLHFIQSTMKSSMFRPKSQAQADNAKEWKRVARFLQKVSFGNNVVLNIAGISLGMLSEEKLIHVAHKPSILHRKIFFVCQAAMVIYTAQMCSTYVSVITSLLVEIIIQLSLLEKTLESLEDDEGIRQCVEWHLQILVFVNKVQRLCGTGLSGVFFCGLINICTSLAMLVEVENAELLFLLPYLAEMIFIIYSHCWCGSEVIYQSEKISSAIYSSQWMNTDTSYKKNINMYIMLTQKPLKIRLGGGIATASLPVFVSIIRSAYSAFTIIQGYK